MHFSTAVVAAAAGFMTLAVANPVAKRSDYPKFIPVTDAKSHPTPKALVADVNIQTVGVYICTEPNGLGNCAYVLNIPGACTSLTNTEFQDDIEFVDPSGNANTPAATCTVYIDENCVGASEVISQPYGNLAIDGNSTFNNEISSFSCVASA